MPFPGGKAFAVFSDGITDREDKGFGGIRAFVKYSYAFRNSPWRREAIPEMPEPTTKEGIAFLNKNIRQLSRIGTFLMWRRRRYAKMLIEKTLPLLNVKYVECLTAHNDVSSLLENCGFKLVKNITRTKTLYYIWKNDSAI